MYTHSLNCRSPGSVYCINPEYHPSEQGIKHIYATILPASFKQHKLLTELVAMNQDIRYNYNTHYLAFPQALSVRSPQPKMLFSLPRILWTILLIHFLAGCAYFKQPSIPHYAPAIQKAAAMRLEARKTEALENNLAEKADFFEERIFSTFKAPQLHIFGETDYPDKALTIDLEATALMLATMLAKYQCTQDAKDLRAIEQILDGLEQLDALNGLDGFLPYQVNAETLQITNGRTHSNAYAQIMFAYVLIAQTIPGSPAHQKVLEQAARIAQYFIRYEFKMHDAKGLPIEFSNLKPRRWQLSRSRNLDFLVIAECLRGLLPPNSPHQSELKRHLQEAIRVGYLQKIQTLSFHFLDIRIPTDGSDWLNMIRLKALTDISSRPEYASAFARLYRKQFKEKNPFFAILYQDRSQEATIQHYLDSFPLSLDNQLILPAACIELKKRPPLIKHSRTVEAVTPAPIYQRPPSDNMWKNNPFRVHGGNTAPQPVEFSGSDFTLAYWLGRMYGLVK